MCIIAYKPAGEWIKRGTLEECYNSNRDGCGFMYVEDGELIIKKGYFNFDAFWKDYLPIAKTGRNVVSHFRVKTAGSKKKENCHPFRVNKHMAMCHNGILTDFNTPARDKDMTDSELFVDNVLARLPKSFLNNKVYITLLEEAIRYSKIAIMTSDDEVVLLNEGEGVWDDKCWYSNSYGYKKSCYSANNRGRGSWRSINRPYNNQFDPYGTGDYQGRICGGRWNSKTRKYEETKPSEDSVLVPLKCNYCGKELSTQFEQEWYLCSDCYENVIADSIGGIVSDLMSDGEIVAWCSSCNSEIYAKDKFYWASTSPREPLCKRCAGDLNATELGDTDDLTDKKIA